MKMRADAYKITCPLFFFEKRDETHSSDAMHKADTSAEGVCTKLIPAKWRREQVLQLLLVRTTRVPKWVFKFLFRF